MHRLLKLNVLLFFVLVLHLLLNASFGFLDGVEDGFGHVCLQALDRFALCFDFFVHLSDFVFLILFELFKIFLRCVFSQVFLDLPNIFFVRFQSQILVKLLDHLLHLPVFLTVFHYDLFKFLDRYHGLLVQLLIVLVKSVTLELLPYPVDCCLFDLSFQLLS